MILIFFLVILLGVTTATKTKKVFIFINTQILSAVLTVLNLLNKQFKGVYKMKIKEVCKILNTSERTFRSEHKKQQFNFVTTFGQNLIVHEKAFYDWLDYGNNTQIKNNNKRIES